jgi:hypothetical protein
MESWISRRSDSREHLIDEIRRALETRDVDALAELYAEDAVLEEVSALHPPAHPVVVHGREAIRKRLRDDFMRDPVGGWHREVKNTSIIDEVETDDAIAFTEVRTYEAGDKVVTQHMAHKRNGLIEHDRLVVARDSD